ncbi:MAG: DUF4097 family beta strand repeat-containing protein [Bacteroidota bacterium]
MKKILLYTLLNLVIVYPSSAQDEVHVVTKSIEKDLDYSSGEQLEIRAEKASIKVETWSKGYISLEIKLISKHKRKEVATSELELLKYEISKTNGKHLVTNYFEADDKFVRVKGNLQAAFNLKLPPGCDILIVNHYGKLSVTNLKSDMDATLKFVDCQVFNGTGSLTIESSFGNIFLNGYGGRLRAKLERSKLELTGFDGVADLNTRYGEVDIDGGSFKKLEINGVRTQISFTTFNLESYNYDVKTTFSAIRVPERIVSYLSLSNEYQEFLKNFNDDNPKIKLHTTYGSINLKQTFSASTK